MPKHSLPRRRFRKHGPSASEYAAFSVDTAKAIREADPGGCSLISGGFVRPENGAKAFAYWFPADLMTTDFESTVTFEVAVKNLDTEKLRLVDPMDGSVYTVPDTIMKPAANGTVLRFEHLPVRDYPLFLTFGDFVGVTEE